MTAVFNGSHMVERITFRISSPTLEQLRELQRQTGMEPSQICRLAVEEFIARRMGESLFSEPIGARHDARKQRLAEETQKLIDAAAAELEAKHAT